MKMITKLLPLAALAIAAYAQPGGFEGRRGPMRPSPAFSALDTNHDGVLSAEELRNAAKSLKGLDKDGDGTLSAAELRPNFPGRPEGGAANPDMVKTLLEFDRNGDGQLSKDEVPERMQGIFARGDKNNDGLLSKEELTQLAQSQAAPSGGDRGRGPGRGGPPMDPLLSALDTDRNGDISAAELQAAPTALAKLDKNGDGQLTADEVRPAFGGRGPGGRNPEGMINHLFEENDKNGDGKLASDEMPERMREMFSRADANNDGFITKDELKKMFEQGGFGPRR